MCTIVQVTTNDVMTGMVDSSTEGGHHSQHNVSTPSTGTTSKSSTRYHNPEVVVAISISSQWSHHYHHDVDIMQLLSSSHRNQIIISRSRTISKCSELSWLPSSSSSQVPSPKVSRANYWANYKVRLTSYIKETITHLPAGND